MKKSLFLYLTPIPICAIPVIATISCQATVDQQTMNWTIDAQKVQKLRSSQTSIDNFNKIALSVEKLKEVIKLDKINNNNGNDFIERYTLNAFNEGWFETISFENNSNKKLVIRLKKTKEINGKTINCPYVLPNGSLEILYQ